MVDKAYMAYAKPNGAETELSLLSALEDNNAGNE